MGAWLKANGLKVLLTVILLFAAGGIVWFQSGDPRSRPARTLAVCVETGETFEMPIEQLGFGIAKNPKTGRETLIPAYADEDDGNKLKVSPRVIPVLKKLGALNKCVDLKTLEVRPKSG